MLREYDLYQTSPDHQGERVPAGTRALHLSTGETYESGELIPRRGPLLVCRTRVERQVRGLRVALRQGRGEPVAHRAWCSVSCTVDDLAALAAHEGASRSALSLEELDNRLREQLPDTLRTLDGFDLASPAARPVLEGDEAADRPHVLPGVRITRCVIRRLVTAEAYLREQRELAEAELAVQRLRNDMQLAEAAEKSRAEQALAAIENERLRSLLTAEEQQLPTAERLELYAALLPARSRSPWVTRRMFLAGVAALGAAVFLAPLLYYSGQAADPLALYWHGFGQRLREGTWTDFRVADGMTMFDGDQFRIHFVPTADCYAYILCLKAEGGVARLFPNPAIGRRNPCRAGQEVQVPDGACWFTLNEAVGIETLFLVGSREPLPALEEQLELVAREGESGAGASAVLAELDRIALQNQPGEDGEVRTPAGMVVRGIQIQPDRRLTRVVLETGERVEAEMQLARGKATVVHRIQFSHVHPP